METFFTDPDDGSVWRFGGEPSQKARNMDRRQTILKLLDIKPSKRPSVMDIQSDCAHFGHDCDRDTIIGDFEWLSRNGATLRHAIQQSKAS